MNGNRIRRPRAAWVGLCGLVLCWGLGASIAAGQDPDPPLPPPNEHPQPIPAPEEPAPAVDDPAPAQADPNAPPVAPPEGGPSAASQPVGVVQPMGNPNARGPIGRGNPVTPSPGGLVAPPQPTDIQRPAEAIYVAMDLTVENRPFGRIVLELDPAAAPKTVENFLHYVQTGFYNQTIFHRVIPDFILQGGGYTAPNQPKKEGLNAAIANESKPRQRHARGTLAAARIHRDPNSATSQFFINLADNRKLDRHNYCIFGKVAEGMDVIDRLVAETPVESSPLEPAFQTRPVKPPMIQRAYRLPPDFRPRIHSGESPDAAAPPSAISSATGGPPGSPSRDAGEPPKSDTGSPNAVEAAAPGGGATIEPHASGESRQAPATRPSPRARVGRPARNLNPAVPPEKSPDSTESAPVVDEPEAPPPGGVAPRPRKGILPPARKDDDPPAPANPRPTDPSWCAVSDAGSW